jgi:hypothetical protein
MSRKESFQKFLILHTIPSQGYDAAGVFPVAACLAVSDTDRNLSLWAGGDGEPVLGGVAGELLRLPRPHAPPRRRRPISLHQEVSRPPAVPPTANSHTAHLDQRI